MACKCTQTTINATGGGAITSALSACTYPLWINHVSGCTGSALDIHVGNPGANILFNIGQYDYYEVGYATNNIGINVPNPIHTVSIGGTIDVENYLHLGPDSNTGDTAYSVYVGHRTGDKRVNNANSDFNTAVGTTSLGSSGILNDADSNTAVGYGTLANLTSGDKNTVVGAGSAGGNLTSQSGNVYLGYGQGSEATVENNTLRIGNNVNGDETSVNSGRYRPLIQGDFSTSATTIWGSTRIVSIPGGDDGMVTIDEDGFLHVSKYTSGPATGTPVKISNTGIWTANTTDASGLPWDLTNGLGYRSVSISGGTNHTATSTDWSGTRVGIGTQYPEVPFHVKAPYGWSYVQSTENTSSYIASVSAGEIAYLGLAAADGVQSGSTTWRLKSFSSPLSLAGQGFIGTGFSIMRASRSVAADGGTQKVVNPFAILGDTATLDSALVLRGDTNLGGLGGDKGVGIFTAKPTKELTVVGSISGTGAIHSTQYIQFPNPSSSTYIGYGADSGNTTNLYNTVLGHDSFGSTGTLGDDAIRNTAIGYHTLKVIGQGVANTAIGSESHAELTSGSRNTGVGVKTLQQLATGSDNIAIGYGVGIASNGDRQTLIGSQSAENDTGGIQNTTAGYQTLYSNVTGRDNVALGHGAAKGGGGSFNYNTAIGAGSLSGITTGGCNVAVGNNAGAGILVPAGKITTGSNNIVIGCQADVKDGTASNQLNIGGFMHGRDVGATGAINTIGIGTATPNVSLTVNGIISGTTHIHSGGDVTVPQDGKIILDGAGGNDYIKFNGTQIDIFRSNTQKISIQAADVVITNSNLSVTSGNITSSGIISGEQITSTDDMKFSDRLILSDLDTNYIVGNGGGSNNDVEIHSVNDVEIKAGDDINLEATGRVECTQFGAAEPSIAFDLNDTPTHAYIENYSGNEVVGINGSTRRLYFLWQGAIPATNQNWISGEENGGADLTLGSNNDIVMSATSVGIGTTSPITKLDVHHDPTGLSNNTGGGEVVTFGSAGADYAAGFLVQLRGASNWVKADADDTTQQGSLLGIALGAAPSNGILLKGFYKINTADDVTTWTNGGQLYVSVTDGKITESTGSMGSGDYVRVVGYMTTTTNVMYFNPESTYVVIT